MTVDVKNIAVVPAIGDTIFTAEEIRGRVSFWTLFLATVRLKELTASGVNINISCRNNVCNYESIIHRNTDSASAGEGITTTANYAVLLKQLLDKIFNLTPQKAALQNVTLNYSNDTLSRSVSLKSFTSDINSLGGIIEDENSGATWSISGNFSQTNRTFSVTVHSDKSGNRLPLIKELFGATAVFDSLSWGLNGYSSVGGVTSVTGRFAMKGYEFHHQRISDDMIKIPSASFYFSVHAGKNYIEMDSTSKASLSSITLTPFIRYEKDKDKTYTLKLNTDKIQSSEFFRSLPAGMFDEVREIEADGTLKFSLDFNINSAHPEDVIFETSMKKEKFRIRKFGDSNLMKMNGEFTQYVYERGRLVRTFPVGESNPAYTTLDKISPNFVYAVLTSEDGNFFYHNGFNEDAFRKSIAVNFKAGKFVRGGSTISMQLVKNVFLTRKKTIARKAEEALLVWLIESNRLYTKERMLEVYMNIIELGPNIYGIGEAAPFYFKKTPAELTLPEGIFLASLLPHPKWFKYSFDTLGNLKPYLADYYRIVSDFMLKKELITQQQHDELQPHVTLLGPAREMVIPSDTIPREEEDEIQ
jgi:hypothetical protein